jgi:hypothetical protein
MTSGSGPRHNVEIQLQNEHTAKCSVSFISDEVQIVVERPTDAAGKDHYHSAHSQCLQRMVAVPPNDFDCELSGKVSAPCTKFILRKAMLEKLPLLLDISERTCSKEQAAAPLELPCSVWGFVSLLLLLEGKMKLSEWFRGDSDTSLPTQTLLVRPDDRKPHELQFCLHEWPSTSI